MRAVREALDPGAGLRALAVLAPLVALYALSRDAGWLQAALVAIALFVAHERVDLAPVGLVAQGLAIVAGVGVLSYALPVPIAFTAGCAALAAMSVALSLVGARLRSLGNYIFIPALYLSYETAIAHGSVKRLLPYLAVGALPPIVAAGIAQWRRAALQDRWRALVRWHAPRGPVVGAPRDVALPAMLAVACAVAVAAALVVSRKLEGGQWVVWSAASVVTGSVAESLVKLRDRGLGALVGAPLGLLVGYLLPAAPLAYTATALASILTLVSFRHYASGFAARCACIACAVWIAQQSAAIAVERVVDVWLGGLIGCACMLVVAPLAGRVVGLWNTSAASAARDA
jgi:hypothetical protein